VAGPSLVKRSSEGRRQKKYSCPFSVRGRVNAARDRIRAPERALHDMEAALKKLDKKYPGRTAPPASADRYNALLARARAQLKSANEAISRYNQTLRDACDKY
jgi:outer membrane protein TolC